MKFAKRKIILLLILSYSFLVRAPAFFLPHQENDEIIYQTLIEKTTFRLKDYTLQKTTILDRLAKSNYDFAVFYSPPLFVYSSALIDKILGVNCLMLLPVFSSLLTIWLTYKIGEKIYYSQKGLLAAGILAICPITLFASTKIWLDSFLSLWVTLSVYFALKTNKNKIFVFFSGLSFTAGLMTKYPAIFILPTIFLIIAQKVKAWQEKLKALFYFFLPVTLALPWFFYHYQKVGRFFEDAKPSAELINMFPFIALIVKRPIHFYLTQTIALFPLYLLPLIKMFKPAFLKRNLILVVWILSFLLTLTFYGASGGGYVTRLILPLFPSLAILTANSVKNLTNLVLLGLCLSIIYALFIGIFNSYIITTADLVNIFILLKI